jgi:hypothetical protein
MKKLPFYIEVLFYPLNAVGIITICSYIAIWALLMFAGKYLGLIGLGLRFLLLPFTAYLYWYLAECVRDSALGGVRTPDVLGGNSISEMFSQMLELIAVLLIFIFPAALYYAITKRADTIYYALKIYSVLFFPMALLAVIMFNTLRALNPKLIIASIFSTIVPYICLVLVLPAVLFAFSFLRAAIGSGVANFITYIIWFYFLFVYAHILGRFYHKYKRQLNWEV